jgi:hypothetical protein
MVMYYYVVGTVKESAATDPGSCSDDARLGSNSSHRLNGRKLEDDGIRDPATLELISKPILTFYWESLLDRLDSTSTPLHIHSSLLFLD